MDSPLSLLILAGFMLKVAGFFFRDELALRALVASGMLADLLYYALLPTPLIAPVLSNGTIIAINMALIFVIIFERTRIGMSAEDIRLYGYFETLSPGQFRRISRHAETVVTDTTTPLIREGVHLDKLYFIDADHFQIEKRGMTYRATGPSFVGEIAFLTGQVSSASVLVPPATRVIVFDVARLKTLMGKRPALNNGMIALFGRDLAQKVAQGVPMDQVSDGTSRQ
ncbi:hypothetical protein ACSSV4_003387 [Roseovarius sp. MBR-154]|jgi:hypothetical protein